jgi:ATP-dependent 26S proteasome regulatory subunit
MSSEWLGNAPSRAWIDEIDSIATKRFDDTGAEREG